MYGYGLFGDLLYLIVKIDRYVIILNVYIGNLYLYVILGFIVIDLIMY